MNHILKIVLSLSLSGSLLILILILCKHFLKNKISRQWQYYIWLIVIARLLLPFASETNLMGNIFQKIDSGKYPFNLMSPSQQNPSDSPNFNYTSIDAIELNKQENVLHTKIPSNMKPIYNLIIRLKNNIWLIWLVIALILLIRKITIYQSFISYIKAGQIPVSDTTLLDQLAVIGTQANVKRAVELCINPLISSPLLIGFFHPCIVLPSADISEKNFYYIVLHELTHYQRKDMFYKWLTQITICLHWFNPLVYLMGHEINKACEFSCDETVIRKLDATSTKEYGSTLLESMAMVGKYKQTLASVTLSENKKLLKERLHVIMNYKKKPMFPTYISILLAFVFLCGATFIGVYTNIEKSTENTHEDTNTNASIHNSEYSNYNLETKNTSNSKKSHNSSSASAPDNLPINTIKADHFTSTKLPNIDIIIDNNASVDLSPTSDNQIAIDYPSTLYKVSIENKDNNYKIYISYIGTYSKYSGAVLYIPEVIYGTINLQVDESTVSFNRVFQNVKAINANMKNSCLFYTIPANFTGTLNAIVPDCYVELGSDNEYKNCDVTISNCATFGSIADGFTKQGNSLKYSNGKQTGIINIDLKNGGYMSMESPINSFVK